LISSVLVVGLAITTGQGFSALLVERKERTERFFVLPVQEH
jgi:hypothetical protein